MRRHGPIGVFDSGFGGLSVLREIRARLPGEDLLYCADHAALPYGERSPAMLRARAHGLVSVLAGAQCRAIVIACNTATAAAADDLRAAFALPIIGMEPAVKPAAAATTTGVVGVLGTGGTLRSARFSALLARYADDLQAITQPAPELVVAIETMSTEERAPVVAAAVAPLLDAGADVIVLGCTHFPLIRNEIAQACGSGVTLIDTGPAVARELVRRLSERGEEPTAARAGSTAFRTTGDARALAPTLARLWGEPVPLESIAAEQITILGGEGSDGQAETGPASRLSSG